MKIFDSNVWIAFFNKNDSQHVKAVRLMEREPSYTLTEYCALETASILSVKSGQNVASAFLDHINDNMDVTILYSSSQFFEETVRLFQSLDENKLSFVDVSLLLLSRDHEIITFDKALSRAIAAQRA